MQQRTLILSIPILMLCVLVGCRGRREHAHDHTGVGKSYAIYAEFARDSNIVMKDGLNRRVFDTIETQSGSRITLEKDGSITLKPGTYRLTGFSCVTMQTTLTIPVPQHNENYPGYCLVYPKEYEQDSATILKHQIGIGSPGTALDMNPSLFDLVYTCKEEAHICVGHQSGAVHGEVYLSVYSVGGIPSPYHVFARVAVTEM